MCEITKPLKRITDRERIGWKCILYPDSRDTWKPICLSGEFARGAWVKSPGGPGFQCYFTYWAARKSGWSTCDRPVKVRVRKITGYGDFAGSRIMFAQEIFIPKGKGVTR